MPDGQAKSRARNRFYIRLAALYASERGTLTVLSRLIGININTLKSQTISKVQASPETKEGIRRILGNDFVPYVIPSRNNDL